MNNPNFNKILADALAKQNKKTNADRIRAMADEELAEFLGENDSYFPIGDHKKYWLDWLRQEVNDVGQ